MRYLNRGILAIRINGWLTELEIEEIARSIKEGGSIVRDQVDKDESQNVGDGGEGGNSMQEGLETHKTSSISIDDSLELDIEQSNMVQRLLDIYAENEQAPNVNFKYVERRKLNAEVNKINAILGKIKTTDITATNRLVIACTRLVAERLGLRERVKKKTETPRWKRRLENDVAELRRSLSRLEQKEKGELRDDVRLARIQRKYKVQQKGIHVVIEELKQRIVAKSEKIKRYSNRNIG